MARRPAPAAAATDGGRDLLDEIPCSRDLVDRLACHIAEAKDWAVEGVGVFAERLQTLWPEGTETAELHALIRDVLEVAARCGDALGAIEERCARVADAGAHLHLNLRDGSVALVGDEADDDSRVAILSA